MVSNLLVICVVTLYCLKTVTKFDVILTVHRR